MTSEWCRGRRIFVTGASGFVGTHLVRRLADEGADVHVLARHGRTALDARVTVHQGDLLDSGSLRIALAAARPSVVFHLAAYGARPDEGDRQLMTETNVGGSVNLWNGIPDVVTKFVMTGTCREYAPADGPVDESYPCGPARAYPATKHAASTLLAALASEDGRPFVLLRLFGPYGPGDETDRIIPFTIRRLLAGEGVPITGGEQRYDFAYIDDHVNALLLAARLDSTRLVSVFNIGGGESRSLRAVLEDVARAVGPDARARLEFGAVPYRPGDTHALCADISAARSVLGYEPAVSLEEGLARTVAWHRARRHRVSPAPVTQAGYR